MPSFLVGSAQHSTADANSSRVVTKIRWIIEAVNSRIKKWKYFANVLSNMNWPHIESDFLIICAIINKFRPQIASTDDFDKIGIYNKMVRKSLDSNPFRERCTNEFKKRILRRNLQLDPAVLNFPELSEEYIQRLTFGVYRLKQARSYTGEHLDEKGNYIFEMFKEETNVNCLNYVFCNLILVKIYFDFR